MSIMETERIKSCGRSLVDWPAFSSRSFAGASKLNTTSSGKSVNYESNSDMTTPSTVPSPQNSTSLPRNAGTDVSRDNKDSSSNQHAHDGGAIVNFSDRAISIVALVLAGIAIGVLLMMPAYIDRSVQAGIAKAEATANEARTQAALSMEYNRLTKNDIAVVKDRLERK